MLLKPPVPVTGRLRHVFGEEAAALVRPRRRVVAAFRPQRDQLGRRALLGDAPGIGHDEPSAGSAASNAAAAPARRARHIGQRDEGSGELQDSFPDLFPCEAMFGMHNAPGVPAGQFELVPGDAMASGDARIIKVAGNGGHGAMPHHATDPVVAAADIVMAPQSVVSRNAPPLQAGIVTVGALLAGDAPNAIPGKAELRRTVRAFRPEVRELLERTIGEIAQAQAESRGVHAGLNCIRRGPVPFNDAKQTAVCEQVIREWRGDADRAPNPEPVSASEELAFFLEKVPGCDVNIGNGVGEQAGCMVHDAGYDCNDAVHSSGATCRVKRAEAYLRM